jgi:hypothetical protein
LRADRAFATDGEVKLKASRGECILFPRAKAKVGGEACLIGEFVD